MKGIFNIYIGTCKKYCLNQNITILSVAADILKEVEYNKDTTKKKTKTIILRLKKNVRKQSKRNSL